MNKIFICHSSDDHNFVSELCEKLKKDGFKVWIDEWEIKVGDSIIQKINRGIEESSFFIIVLSQNSIRNDWVNKELSVAIMKNFSHKKIKILPILLEIEPEEMPPLLLDIKAAKFKKNSIDKDEYAKLIEPIKDLKKANALNKYQDKFFDDIEHIDIILNKMIPTQSEVNYVLNIINKVEYANYFFKKVKYLSWFYILQENGYFNPDKIPLPEPAEKEGYYKIPYWNVLDYLVKVSQQTNIPDNEVYADELIKIIKEVTQYFKENKDKLDNSKVWWMFIEILSNLPNHKVNDEVLKLIPYWFRSKLGNYWQISEVMDRLLPKFVKSNDVKDIEKAEEIFKFLVEIKWEPYWKRYPDYKYLLEIPEEKRTVEEKNKIRLFKLDKKEPKLMFDHFLLFLPEKKTLIKQLGEKCSKDLIYWLADNIKNLFQKEKYNESYDLTMVWIDNIFHLNYGYAETLLILIMILGEMLLAKSKVKKEDIIEILNKFIKEYNYPIFKRYVLLIAGTEWLQYRQIFWTLVEDDKKYELFNMDKYSNDLYYVFYYNAEKLDDEEKKKIEDIVENRVPDKPHSEEQYKEYYAAYRKQKFYQALKSDDYFKKLYDRCKEITKTDVETTNIKSYSGPGISPLSKDDILNKKNTEIAEFFHNFKSKGYFDEPSVNGLCQVLKEIVSNYPQKFYNDLNPFIKSPYIYIYYILLGFSDALDQKKELDWEKIIDFIDKSIQEDDFWKDNYKLIEHDSNHLWVVGNIGWLIRKGLTESQVKIPEKYYLKIFELLMFILEKMELNKEINKESDYIMLALNSAIGKILESLILTVWCMYEKIKNENKKIEEDENIKRFIKKYSDLLGKKNIESYVWLGNYLILFDYLDKKWTENVLSKLINAEVELWEAFITGCSYNEYFYDLYDLLKPYYKKLINYENNNLDTKQVSKRIIEHICIWYLEDKEKIEATDSLFRELIDRWDNKQITDIINFFWMERRELNDKEEIPLEYIGFRKKIIYFWKWIYENKFENKTNFTNNDIKILSELSKLTIFLDEINNENIRWLKLSARFVNIGFNYSFFIEYLDCLKYKGGIEKVKNYVGEMYLEILKSSDEYPQYPQENIESIVKFLFKSGNKKDANEICELYCKKHGDNGIASILRKYYEENK